MAANFDFLRNRTEYQMFAAACLEAERVLATSPAMSAVGSRKALELALKWVYAADNTIRMPYKDNLQSLLHEPTFRFAVDNKTWSKLLYVVKLGNIAVHTDKAVTRSEALLALQAVFEFVQWIDYCYGSEYEERFFDENLVPSQTFEIDEAKILEQQSLLEQKESEINALRAQVAALSAKYTGEKERHKEERHFTPVDPSEYETRKKYIDVDLKLLGWTFGDDVREEVEVTGMPNAEGVGYVDYVLYGKDGLPLALIEAKRTSRDPKIGTHQAKLYADCLERMTGRRPIIFTTNGFETNIWESPDVPQRKVSGLFSRRDLEKLINRRTSRRSLHEIRIDDRITDRPYQKEAIRAVAAHLEAGHRKALLVMATGTGKTRTAASLTDVLSRGGYVTNVLFLADRRSLVSQAKNDFAKYLKDMTLCNLLDQREDKLARIVFSTYPTILNTIDTAKSEDGSRLYTPAHFDLIIIDEAHRSIFNKYRAIFEYFDALMLGLTATPKAEVDRNTYEFFEVERGVPTYAYEYETAVYKDHVLVPYYNIEVGLKFLTEGITYDELSEEDKARYEEDFADEDGNMPEEIPSPEINEFIFNQHTVDTVIQDLMTKGIKVAGGDRIGKTIIFAQNKRHAQYIVDRFHKLYPHLGGQFIQKITYEDAYAEDAITNFKKADNNPHIAVSVDMLDTGIDVPEVVNLVFFKRVRSKTKFWQMIGRGTRLCRDLFGPGEDKAHFVIFDYLGNFEFFRQHKEGLSEGEVVSLTEAIFRKRIKLIHLLQHGDFAAAEGREMREGLIDIVVGQIEALNPDLIAVKLRLQVVEKYKHRRAFLALSESDVLTLGRELGPIVYMDERDEHAKRFDNLMYGLMVYSLEGSRQFARNKNALKEIARNLLTERATIPAVRAKLELIRTIESEAFWENATIFDFERIRVELRELAKFTVDESGGASPIYTNLRDEVLYVKEGEPIDSGYDFEDYKLKVNRYIEENRDHIAIYKLRNNTPLTAADYEALERIFTGELGTAEDYKREFKDTPFGLLVRKIAKLEPDAVNQAFSEFINDESLTQQQIVFVRKVIDYIVQNGYIENAADLAKPPFDKPQSFLKLFDGAKQKKLVETVKAIKENAVKIVG